MIEILGYIFFMLAGLLFGLFGSGGSIIIIPILIYIFKLSIYEATTYSLLLVFITSFIGTVKHIYQKNFHIPNLAFFIVPTLVFTFLSRTFLFPALPDYFDILNISKDSLLMLLFSVVIFLASLSFFRKIQINIKSNDQLLFLIGVIIGVLTGLLGIGGGFIIVPSLVLFAGLDMRQAASSTLFIIMLNTLLALILELTIFQFKFNISFIIELLSMLLMGIIIGIKLLNNIDLNIVKKLFSITLLVLSLCLFLLELF
tara:strand:- start:337 stop:1107 length:771 start_codon:yes stop_codon:yes gene_type:complete